MTSKIRIKMGPIEIEYEGSESFLKEELPDLLSAVSTLYHSTGEGPENDQDGTDLPPPAGAGSGSIQATTSSIATTLGAKSGKDLVRAAAGHLTLVKTQDTFTRKELLAEMQTATGHYSSSYSGNLSKYLKGAVSDGLLIERTKGTYAMKSTARQALRTALDQA